MAVDAAQQHYLFEARQLQALSFAVHIPLVCFGIAFPALVRVLRVARPANRRRDLPDARAPLVEGHGRAVRRGRRDRNDPELRARHPVAGVHVASSATVFGLGFTLEGFSFFVEAIFIGIYIYGWDRMSPRMHMLAGVPIVVAGIAGSLMVIAVNGWMNHPGGFRIVDGQRRRRAPVVGAVRQPHVLARARAHVPRRLHGRRASASPAVYAWGWLRGRRGRYERIAHRDPARRRRARRAAAGRRRRLGGARRRALPARQARGVRGPRARRRRARPCTCSAGTRTATSRFGIEVPRCSRCSPTHDPNATIAGLDSVPGGRSASGQRRAHRVPDDGRRSARCSPRSRSSCSGRGGASRRLPRSPLVLPRGRARRAALARRADRRLGDDRGRPAAVDRVRRDADRAGRHRRERDPGGVRDARRSSTSVSASRSGGCCAGSPRRRLPEEDGP